MTVFDNFAAIDVRVAFSMRHGGSVPEKKSKHEPIPKVLEQHFPGAASSTASSTPRGAKVPFVTTRLRRLASRLESMPDNALLEQLAGDRHAAPLLRRLAEVEEQMCYGTDATTTAAKTAENLSEASFQPRQTSAAAFGTREEARQLRDAVQALVDNRLEAAATAEEVSILQGIGSEVSAQAHASCIELGEALHLVVARFAGMMRTELASSSERERRRLYAQETEQTRSAELAAEAKATQREHARAESERERADTAETRMRELRIELEGEKERLNAMMEDMQTELEEERNKTAVLERRLQYQARSFEEDAAKRSDEMQRNLEQVGAQRDRLASRVRYLEQQLAKATDSTHAAALVEVSVQTDDTLHRNESDSVPRPENTSNSLKDATEDESRTAYEHTGHAESDASTSEQQEQQSETDGIVLGRLASIQQKGNVEKGSAKTIAWALRIVGNVYHEKYALEQVNERVRAALPDVTADFLTKRYGLRSLAQSQLRNLAATVRWHANSEPRLRMYGQLLGVVPAPLTRCNDDAAAFHINCIVQLLPKQSSIVSIFESNQLLRVKPAHVAEVARTLLPSVGHSAAHLRAFMRRMQEHSDESSGLIRMDAVLELMMEAFDSERYGILARLRALHRAADTDADGLVAFEAFVEAARASGVKRDVNAVAARAYRDARTPTANTNAVDATEFAHACIRHGIKPPKVTRRWNRADLTTMPEDCSASSTAPTEQTQCTNVHETPPTTAMDKAGADEDGPLRTAGYGDLIMLEDALQDAGAMVSQSDALAGATVDDALERAATAAGETSAEIVRARQLREHLDMLLQQQHDHAAAWETFRLLMAHVDSILSNKSASTKRRKVTRSQSAASTAPSSANAREAHGTALSFLKGIKPASTLKAG